MTRGRLRAHDLRRIKTQPIYRNGLVQRLLYSSPTVTHLLEDCYRLVLARIMRPEAKADADDLEARIAEFAARFPDAIGTCDEEPVFLLAAGWRSGSTLLQRVLMSSGELLIWGEPFARSGIVQKLSDHFRAFTREWPPPSYFVDSFPGELSGHWIANSYPCAADLIASHRAFLIQLLAAPAHSRGRKRWGFKEVRLDGGHARYLKLLFPKARLVFLVRDPYACYASFRHYIKSDFLAWPETPIHSAKDFGGLWRRLASSFEDAQKDIGGLWLQYEEYLRDPGLHRALCEYVGADLKPPDRMDLIASSGHAGVSETRSDAARLLWWERRGIERAAGECARRLGYSGARG
ncbi:MAG: sulfotransferase [Geminicoccaceae bacterium]|nr:sulfotransferase [Geminicoccaceae bacterium]MCB9969348.1 sulfotransferase [Geminicoccaceae bacterium]